MFTLAIQQFIRKGDSPTDFIIAMSLLITICARGGSKGIPGKNVKVLNGKPLIYYSIDIAKRFQQVVNDTTIIVSSDSQEIIEVSEKYGIKTGYRRPGELAGDSTGKVDAIQDALLWVESKMNCRFDYVLDLDVTSPLRNLQDLTEAYKIIESKPDAYNLFSVSPSSRNPYFNMVEEKENGFYNLVKTTGKIVVARQYVPLVYDMNASFYFFRRRFFDLGMRSSVTERSLVYVMPHICFDLDHPMDFEIMSFLMESGKLGFDL